MFQIAKAGSSDDQGVVVSEIRPDIEGVRHSKQVSSIKNKIDISLEYEGSKGFLITLQKSELEIRTTIIPTENGELAFMTASDGRIEASFFFNDESKIPQTEFDAPEEVSGTLTGRTDSTVFTRKITGREIKNIKRSINDVSGKIYGVTGTHTLGYKVWVPDESEEVVWEYTLDSEFEVNQRTTVGTASSSSAANGICDAAGFFCYLCVSSSYVCWGCLALCASGIGTLGCVICLVHTCGVQASDCYVCIDCLT